MTYNVAVIGGGASGLLCAAVAGRSVKDIIVLEKNERVGKKILATGNGRCNFTNINVSENNYYGTDPCFAKKVLELFDSKAVINFFDNLGIVAKIEDEGKVYPYSGQAASILSALRNEVERIGIKTATDFDVVSIKKKNDIFEIRSSSGSLTLARNVVIATGGCTPSVTRLLNELGHGVTEIYPALVQLKCDSSAVKALQGIKVDGEATLCVGKKGVFAEKGEILFTNYGVSGPPILQLSGRILGKGGAQLYLDLLPEFTAHQLIEMLERRKKLLNHLTMEDFFVGLLHKKVGQVLSKAAGIDKLSMSVSDLTAETIRALVKIIKALELNITGTTGFANAQVTGGGADTSLFDNCTMESKKVKGLYAVGEVLDIYGDCGGYNLQWAWSSGYAAGKRIAVTIK